MMKCLGKKHYQKLRKTLLGMQRGIFYTFIAGYKLNKVYLQTDIINKCRI